MKRLKFIRTLKSKETVKNILCMLLIVSAILNILVAIPTKADNNTVVNYSWSLGTNKALGSPLINETFVEEDWNKWEMLTFGIFLSNFCTPFIDSYRTAFSSGYGGSEGSGRRALVFAAGGDVNSESIINSMLSYCISMQNNLSMIKELKVDYSFYVFNNKMDLTEKQTPRTATLRDILVRLRLNSSIADAFSSIEINFPFVVTNKNEVKASMGLSDLYLNITGGAGDSSGMGGYPFEFIRYAYLSRLFIDDNGKEITVFDTANGYDIQILSSLLAAIIQSASDDDTIIDIIEKASQYNLYMDAFGNICIIHGNEIKVVIPASANQHLTKDKRYNLLNSMFLNGNYIAEDDHTISSGLEATNEGGRIDEDLTHEIRGGNSGADGESEGIKAGQVLIYEDTDIEVAQAIYKKATEEIRKRDADGIKELIKSPNKLDVTWSGDLALGRYITNLVTSKIQRGKISNPLKIEVVGGVNESVLGFLDGELIGELNVDGENIINRMAQAAALLSNAFPMETNHEVLNWMHSYTNEPINLFENSLYVANSVPKSKNILGWKNANEGVKSFISFYLNYLSKNDTLTYTGLDIPSAASQLEILSKITTPSNLAGLVFNGVNLSIEEEKEGSDLLIYYLWTDSHFGPVKGVTLDKIKGLKLQDYAKDSVTGKPKYIKNVDETGGTQFNYENNMADSVRRIIKIYKKNSTFSIVSNYLSLVEGTEFSVYATLIYLTYLDFYGILDGENTHNFNEEIFANSAFVNLNPQEVFGNTLMSEEDQKKMILKSTYLLLSPEAGRDYRNKLASDWLTDWMHREYQKICYGSSATSVVSSNISTRMTEGFLQIDTYDENFLTSWFMKNYSKISIVLMAVFIIVAIIMGIIKNHKLDWFIVALATIVIVFSLAPSTGEITPYICNRMIQRMFSENMTYWAMSESIENSSIEAQYTSGSVKDKEVLSLLNSLNMLYLDKTIMIKKDISKKIIETITVDYGEIQRLKSTRWLLPTIIQQISADDRSADYVYTTLTDLYSDMRSAYWLYARADASEFRTSQFVTPSREYTAYSSGAKVGSLWEGYTDTSYIVPSGTSGIDASDTWKSVARIRDDSDNNFHTLFYMIDTKAIDGLNSSFKIVDPLKVTGYEEYSREMWNAFGEAVVNGTFNAPGLSDTEYKSNFQTMTQKLIEDASTYNSYTTEPKQTFGYLWTTETPAHYFYQIVKDTFKENDEANTLAMLIKQLQGAVELNIETGEETRRTFMHKGDTGYIRDFLDLEELFTNVIPYMYTMQVLAGGSNGENGILGEELMDNYPIYENNLQSWLYRSNWVTKLVEYPTYANPTKVYGRDAEGNKVEYEIASPLYPQNYPDERPMIFSEAQMHELGLSEADLSVVELKLLKINKDVEKSWTLLINYANAKGINKEVFYRQMAISALLAFNKHMSPDNWVSASRALYPTSLDLRNISFDAVMKMIIISDTANSTYMLTDVMYTMISERDMISAWLVLATAWIASYIVPLLRNIVIGLMFYLGLLSMLMGLFRDSKKAMRSAGGYVTSNIIFMVITIAYYAVYALMITTSTVDSVLSVKNISMSTSVPVWKFFIIFATSIAYLAIIIKYLNFVWKNYRDMGYEIYYGIASNVAGKLGDKFESIGNRLSGNISDIGGKASGDGATAGSTDVKLQNTSDEPIKVKLVDSDVSINNFSKSETNNYNGIGESGYIYDSSNKNDVLTADDIDKAIEEGKKKK